MVASRWMARFARWHIWLGWLIAVPLLLWMLSGIAMVARPIEEVRGEHLRIKLPPQPLPGNPQVVEIRSLVQRGRPVTLVTRADGSLQRYAIGTGAPLNVDVAEARAIAASDIRGGDQVDAVRAFSARNPPLELRKPVATWQVSLVDGTHVYINRGSGEIEAVRTRWWRFYDVMWGLHIMDLQTREDAHNPFVVVFALIALIGALLGTVLLFRRRRARVGI
ncbi:hypothetical protein E0504_09790 [Parafrankia sp. BMG5.11]|nr:hypothetical protein E0504_09790 [Parafrankia sp. BMG5.11]